MTFNSFSIDGTIRRDYYTEEELEEEQIGALSAWGQLQPVCFSLIKGKKLPASFRIELVLPREGVEELIAREELTLKAEEVGGFHLLVRYEEGELYCISGTSLNYFTLDKSVDTVWDKAVKQFLEESEIAFAEE